MTAEQIISEMGRFLNERKEIYERRITDPATYMGMRLRTQAQVITLRAVGMRLMELEAKLNAERPGPVGPKEPAPLFDMVPSAMGANGTD